MSESKTRDPAKAKQGCRRLAAIAVVVVIALVVGATLKSRSFNSLNFVSNDWTWKAVSWRARVFQRKAEGDIPDLSWRELWFMLHPRGGFGLESLVKEGFSLEGSVANPYFTSHDHENGAEIFRERCVVCHGKDGTGGFGPRLNHSGLGRGDSDLAVYKTLRDGIPGTGMAAVAMSPQERWQVVGYLRTLQLASSSKNTEQSAPLDIQVSFDQIRTAGSKPDQWLTFSGSLDGRRYALTSEVTPDNVSRLRVLWVHQSDTSESSRSEATPIVVGGYIFTTEPPSDVVALEAKTGKLRWRYRRSLPDKLPTESARASRGLAVLANVLFFASVDGVLVALNASNGNVLWQTTVVNTSDGYTLSGAPLVVNGSVIVGVAGGEYGIRGFLVAYDAKTGQQQWKFNAVPDPGEFGHDTWKNDAWKTGGGTTWVTGSYDASLGLIYWGTGNPSPGFNGDVRPGDNLFTNCMLALQASTGN
jgi:alcohol dehydrogenase (cytochrome c)